MVVLGILILINLVVLAYFIYQLELRIKELIHTINNFKYETEVYYGKAIERFDLLESYIDHKCKNLPKEIIVKNVLNIP